MNWRTSPDGKVAAAEVPAAVVEERILSELMLVTFEGAIVAHVVWVG